MKDMRDRGLCYYGETKWQPNHKCQEPKLYLIEEIYEGQTKTQEQKGGDETLDPDFELDLKPPITESHTENPEFPCIN